MGKLNSVLGVDTDAIRIRSFTFNNQVLRVRVPTSSEAEQIFEKTKEPSAELVETKYQEITKPILDAREKLENTEIVFKDDDILFQDKSMRELAKTKASTELRILETFKLLVAGNGGRMEDLTYDDISQDLPLPIQLQLVQRITEVISPSYEETRKN
jgi:hypothetical protein